MMPKKGDGYAELYGIPPVSGARYFKDGKFYNAKLQELDPFGKITGAVPEPEPEPVVPEMTPEPPAEPEKYVSDLELVDRIKIKGAADPDFLTKADIRKELKALGQKSDPKSLRDDLLCQLKEAMGLTGAIDDTPIERVEDERIGEDADQAELLPDFEDS